MFSVPTDPEKRLDLFAPLEEYDTAFSPPTNIHPTFSLEGPGFLGGWIHTSPLGKTTFRRPQYLDHVWQSISSSWTWAVLAPVVGDISKVVRFVRESRTGESAVRRAC
jgi:hypothetical protein